jgi:D-methionine transport system ATP-binding protein
VQKEQRMIQIEHLNKTYVSRQGETHIALTDINLTIEDGSVFGIIGQSGAGKSTLVRCLNLLERPTSGSIIINGRDITSLSEKELREFRSSVSMVFQNFSLLQQRTVLRNVMFPLELRHADKKEAEKRARELLELVGLADKCDKYPGQLSGGQQQRVAIARALVNNPSIMLCDEATSALDSMTTHSILKLLKDINEKMGVTIVLITHSLAVAELICDNVVVIDEGKIVEEGKTEDIFANPQSDVARKLLEKRL